MDLASSDFLDWFKRTGGEIHAAVGVVQLPDMGQGAIAIQNIAKDTTLFTIPRSNLLSTKTCSLKTLLSQTEWNSLGSGWQPLMLCMMWEESKGEKSHWHEYLRSMPDTFDTLMFWTEEELEYLQGSTVKTKIGRDEAEQDYYKRVAPLVLSRPDIFDSATRDTWFSLERYHINGSRILSRSFNVEPWGKAQEPNSDDSDNEIDAMEEDHAEEESADEERESVDEVSMVPMADILNARYGCNNARLYYEKDVLRMVAIVDITAGDQIWNTYGELPNSNLLRRYGHVDEVLLPELEGISQFPYGNPADEIEILADIIVVSCMKYEDEAKRSSRVEAWLGLEGEDVFAIDAEDIVCKPMLSMIRFLQMTEEEVQEAVEKDKVPKGKATGDVLKTYLTILQYRLSQYSTSVQEDEEVLCKGHGISRIQKATALVLGEKRILKRAIAQAEELLGSERKTGQSTSRKRERDSEPLVAVKKTKRSGV